MELGIVTEIPINVTLVDTFDQGKLIAKKGGVHIKQSENVGVTLYENVWHKYKLEHTYVIDEFSRLQFTLQMSVDMDFIGICLTKELHNFDLIPEGKRLACLHLYGDDRGWGNAGFSTIPYNLALGKVTKQNSNFEGSFESRHAVDGASLDTVICDLY